MHLRAIDDHLREHVHKKVLGYGNEKEARSAHDCRRTYASLEYANGTPIASIQLQLGHEKPSQTEAYIKNIVDSEDRKASLHGCGLFIPTEAKIEELPIRQPLDGLQKKEKTS